MKGRVTATKLNVRGRPTLDAQKVGLLTQNALVNISEEITNWYEIQFNQGIAFVHKDYIEPLDTPKPMKGRITASLLNVRSAPELRAGILGTLTKNTITNIVAENGDWLEINFNGTPAFLFSEFVELLASDEEIKKGRVTADVLNVRTQPGAGGPRIGSLLRDSEVEIHNQIGLWYEISFNNSSAFVHGDYVEVGGKVRDKPLNDTVQPTTPQADMPEFLYKVAELNQMELSPSNLLPVEGSSKQKKVINAWNNYGNLLRKLSKIKGIDVGAAIAVMCVESSGRGFGSDNKMIIRFENHQFWKRWGKNNEDTFRKFFKFRDDKKWLGHEFRNSPNGQWQSFHGNQSKEWQVLEFARQLNDNAALDSISMGLPQIMGFNSSIIGYKTVQDMFEKFNSDIRFHLFGLFDFLDKRMIKALQERDFEEFAGYYNGPGQAQWRLDKRSL